jgi:LysR family glycine cleavage system transcriptional activator
MASIRLPSLNAVRAFESAARLGSYVAAAEDLHVTQPAIGRHVKLLEDWLGVKLFDRNPRGVLLTSAGRQYYAAVNAALHQISDAGHALMPQSGMRWLRLLVTPAFAMRWLAPHMESLRTLRPGLRISIEPNASFTELDTVSADVGIAFGGERDYPNRVATLARPKVFPVCTPAYLLRSARLEKPIDLLQHNLIHEDDGWWWSAWFAALKVKAQVQSEVSYVSANHAIELALAGQGIALANEILVKHELNDGRLVQPISAAVVLEGYQLLLPENASPDAIWFCAWLRAALAEEFPEACQP